MLFLSDVLQIKNKQLYIEVGSGVIIIIIIFITIIHFPPLWIILLYIEML